jgi:tRNA-dihydrouridine synthase B
VASVDTAESTSGVDEQVDRVARDLRRRPPVCYGELELPTPFLLSPLAGYTNLPFRRVVRELGGLGLATTDLVNARGLLDGSRKSLALIETCAADQPLAVQIFGSDPTVMRDAAQLLLEKEVASIDINMGCPVKRITGEGSGARLMCESALAVEVVRQVAAAVAIPVTVKMRLGWDDESLTAPSLAAACEDAGAAAIAVHGRTRAQGFSGKVNRQGIRAVVEAVRQIPVVGNGDLRTVPDVAAMFQETGCAAISIGRGALANPWIFRQLEQWRQSGQWSAAGTFADRLQLMQRQFDYLIEQRGADTAISMFRKMAHWYLKSMLVPAVLRNAFQQADTLDQVRLVLSDILQRGPSRGTIDGDLPAWEIPVPSGPNSLW